MGKYDKPTRYRVLWYNGQDAIFQEYEAPLYAVVLDTALEHAVKVAKKYLDTCVVWETGEGGDVVRAFGTKFGLRWPEKLPCNQCKGSGKVWKYQGGWEWYQRYMRRMPRMWEDS